MNHEPLPMTLMRKEAMECPDVSRRFLVHVLPELRQEALQWQQDGCLYMEVLGRGSSSHAGTVLRYAMAKHSPMLVSSAMPLVAQHAQALAKHSQMVLVAISQSGKSPDLIQYAAYRKAQGARVLALVNREGSELGAIAHRCIVLGAGLELAVAATKSTLAASLAGLGLVASVQPGMSGLQAALHGLPDVLEHAVRDCVWDRLSAALPGARAVFFIGRGATLGVAKELALKVCETTGIPAVAYSSAEFLHGPIGSVDHQTPVIALCSAPDQHDSVAQALSRARQRGALCLGAYTYTQGELPLPSSSETYTGALSMLPPAYLAIEAATVAMGRSPDTPAGLTKVTCT